MKMKTSFFKRRSSYLIPVIAIILFTAFSLVQSYMLGIERNIQSYFIPIALGMAVGLITAILAHQLKLKNEKEKIFFLQLVEVLATALDERDKYTHGHSRRVTSMSLQIAALMKLNFEEIELLRLSGILHDIGKIGISDNILLKPGKLTNEEYQLIKEHPSKGARILSQIDDPKIKKITRIIKHHHERYDGKGYPDGLKGKEIPLYSRIIAVADSYDAMTSDRPYRKGMDSDQAIKKMRNGSGTQFDPELLKYFLELFKNSSPGIICSSFQNCEIFSLIQDAAISKAYETQYCRGNYRTCERYRIKRKRERPTNLLPDGSFYHV